MLRSLISLLLVLASYGVVSSQAPSSASPEQMQKLDFLVGEWKGKGWMYRLDGSRSAEISQSTKVKKGPDSPTLKIQDRKKYPDLRIRLGAPFPGTVLRSPIEMSGPASLYYDHVAKHYYWRLEKSAGRKKPFPATLVKPGTLQVKMEFPGTLSVITITVTEEGLWQERLEIWLGDEEGWFKSQQTVLKRVK